MISIRSSADMAWALSILLEPQLRHMLELRRDQLAGDGSIDIAETAHLIVVQPKDTFVAVEREAAIALHPYDHWFEWAERHPGGWIEAVATVTDDFTVVLLVPDRPGIDPRLLDLIRTLVKA